jgi:glycosyltransferase involved in cell wall biosynthesis
MDKFLCKTTFILAQNFPLKRIIISVTTDLATDQRVHRAALTLHEAQFDVLVVGRKLKESMPLANLPYKTKRFSLWWEKGPLFYAAYNLRLFFFLLFNKADILYSNDLDTLLPNYLVSKLKSKKLYYDCHEYFTGMPELEGRKFPYRVWKTIERFIFPKLKNVITINDSMAKLYADEYGIRLNVIRNLPLTSNEKDIPTKSKKDLQLPDKKLIIFQGAGINVDRGAEEALLAMQYVTDAALVFAGSGGVIPTLKNLREILNLQEKVFFTGKLPPIELKTLTRLAHLGLSLDKDTNINYHFSLPNKLFDYIHAGIPVLASPLPEISKIVSEYKIGLLIDNHNPQYIAEKITSMLSDESQLMIWKENLKRAAAELSWEKEKIKFLALFS